MIIYFSGFEKNNTCHLFGNHALIIFQNKYFTFEGNTSYTLAAGYHYDNGQIDKYPIWSIQVDLSKCKSLLNCKRVSITLNIY